MDESFAMELLHIGVYKKMTATFACTGPQTKAPKAQRPPYTGSVIQPKRHMDAVHFFALELFTHWHLQKYQ